MTKQEEIKALEQFIDSLPRETYLHDFFTEEFSAIRETILNDGWYEVTRSMAQLRQERKNLEDRIDELIDQEKIRRRVVDQLSQQQRETERVLKELGEKAGKIWSLLR